jgi:predicted transcriptional regulator
MGAQQVKYFTQNERGFVELLVAIGIRRNVSLVLVFLANTPEATSRDIERGTDLRQPEVSVAMNSLIEKKWIRSAEDRSAHKGRPVKVYSLSRSVSAIMDIIEKEQKEKAKKKLAALQKLRIFVRGNTGKEKL